MSRHGSRAREGARILLCGAGMRAVLVEQRDGGDKSGAVASGAHKHQGHGGAFGGGEHPLTVALCARRGDPLSADPALVDAMRRIA